MLTRILLLDISPEPVATGGGVATLVLIGIVVLVLTTALLMGFVFVMRRLKKTTGAGTRVVIGDACLNLDSFGSRSNPITSQSIIPTAQPESNPNQP
jgi:glycerol-3-phosphate acyltransferase PlsY